MGLSSGCLICNIPYTRVYYADICLACAKKLAEPLIAEQMKEIAEMIKAEQALVVPEAKEAMNRLLAAAEKKR